MVLLSKMPLPAWRRSSGIREPGGDTHSRRFFVGKQLVYACNPAKTFFVYQTRFHVVVFSAETAHFSQKTTLPANSPQCITSNGAELHHMAAARPKICLPTTQVYYFLLQVVSGRQGDTTRSSPFHSSTTTRSPRCPSYPSIIIIITEARGTLSELSLSPFSLFAVFLTCLVLHDTHRTNQPTNQPASQ